MSASSAEPPREMVTPAEFKRRLARARRWWWAGILFFGGGAVSLVGLAVTQRAQLEPTSMAGMAFVVLFALQRLVFLLRRRPH